MDYTYIKLINTHTMPNLSPSGLVHWFWWEKRNIRVYGVRIFASI